MVNSNSAIALYGFQDTPIDMEAKAIDLGIELILVPNQLNKANLGSQLGDLVNKTSALFVYKADENLYTIVQFYFAANKRVYIIAGEEPMPLLPKGIKLIDNTKEALKILLKESEKVVVESRIGNIELRFNAFGLTNLKLTKQVQTDEKISKQAQKIQNQLDAFLEGKRKSFSIKVCLKGTDFQRKVWNKILKIPYGHTLSYGELAHKLGDDKASRAVGLAVSKNPIWFVIPCHRVLSKEGDLTGYAGGLKLKQALLDLESNQMSLF